MDAEKHQTAVLAITDLIRSEIDSPDREKFARIERLCQIGKKLLLEGAKRVKDFRGPQIVAGADFVCQDDDVDEGYQAMPMPEGDTAGLFRGMIQMLGPTLQAQGEAAKARTRDGWVDELNGLLRTKSLLEKNPTTPEQRTRIDQRIDDLTIRISKEIDNADVVPAKPVRRHPPRVEAGGDPPHDLRALPPGADRDDGPLPEGGEGQRALEAVGHVCGHPEDRPREHEGAVDPHERLDLGSAKGPLEATEADA